MMVMMGMSSPSTTTSRYPGSRLDHITLHLLVPRLPGPPARGRPGPRDLRLVSGFPVGRTSCSVVPLERTHCHRGGVPAPYCRGSDTTHTTSDAGEHATQVVLDTGLPSWPRSTLHCLRQRRSPATPFLGPDPEEIAMMQKFLTPLPSIIRGGVRQRGRARRRHPRPEESGGLSLQFGHIGGLFAGRGRWLVLPRLSRQ